MQWLMAGVMMVVALAVLVLTHGFRPMRQLPLISVDWLGCLLWSALAIEVIFLFNYGEYYNWTDGATWRHVAWMVPITLYFAIERMRHIRHPYIAPGAWRYRGLLPLLCLFALVELINSTPKVLQSALTGRVLGYGTMATSQLYVAEWLGTIGGCLFVLVWCKVMRRQFTRLLTLGMMALLAYEVMMYSIVSPGLPLHMLYVPVLLRAMGVAVFFTALTIYLEEIMPFEHFFMGLTMVGFVRNGLMETVCSGVYGYMMRSQLADKVARAMSYDATQATLVSIKQLYGLTCLVGAVVLAAFLLWNVQPVRSTLKRMPSWQAVGRRVAHSIYRRQ